MKWQIWMKITGQRARRVVLASRRRDRRALAQGGINGQKYTFSHLRPVFYGSSTTNCFPTFDGNGNIEALVNAMDGTFAANYEYGPFGEVIRSTGPMAKINPFRFSTKYQDDESDLLYYGYRYYKANTGTWPNRDPIGELGGFNEYNFVANDSLNHYDKYGKKCCLITYQPGMYQGANGVPPHRSYFGHSILSCDNGAYVSLFPEDNGGWHHDPQKDEDYYANGPAPDKQCFDCLDEGKVKDWLSSHDGDNGAWSTSYNCSDATADAILAGLPSGKQKVPCCSFPKHSVDLLDHQGYHLPGDTSRSVKDLVANSCNRYQCRVFTAPLW